VRPLPALLLTLSVAACTLFQPAAINRKFSVFFTERSAALDARAAGVISDAAQLANQFPGYNVTVAGYAGGRGVPEAELQLARQRAQVVENQLVADGVAPGRIRRAANAPASNAATPVESRRVDISIGNP
jgi:outer membrane protein OmpA-like peptidoglycan-associated protein